jgi:uncharacterized membrane protein
MSQRRTLAAAVWHRTWLPVVNVACAAFIGGGLAAPVFAKLGWRSAAEALYAAYHLTCHQWAFRSFFLFGQQPVYATDDLSDLDLDAFTFVGDPRLGWKMAFCERDLAIYAGVLLVGLYFARRRGLEPPSLRLYALLALPMALDGFTQLFGWRESTWELRVLTGLLFGLSSAWLVFPYLEHMFGKPEAAEQYAPVEIEVCAPHPLPNRVLPPG